MKFPRLKLRQDGEYPTLTNMIVFLDDVDLSKSIRKIDIHTELDEITIVNLEFVAELDVDIITVNEKDLK